MIEYECIECGDRTSSFEELQSHFTIQKHKGWVIYQDGVVKQWSYLKTYSDQPTNKYDTGKLRIDLVPPAIIEAVAEIREYGNNKYKDPDSWKTVEPYRYIAALGRHFCEYLRDPQSVDSESGISHLKHMACNIAFLLELEYMKGDENDG